nr:hypothetical protein Iba_scaffold4357CG0040 [Ipomoea batatas]
MKLQVDARELLPQLRTALPHRRNAMVSAPARRCDTPEEIEEMVRLLSVCTASPTTIVLIYYRRLLLVRRRERDGNGGWFGFGNKHFRGS